MLERWIVNPERWHVYPLAIEPGLIAGVVLAVVMGVGFWIKGRYWP